MVADVSPWVSWPVLLACSWPVLLACSWPVLLVGSCESWVAWVSSWSVAWVEPSWLACASVESVLASLVVPGEVVQARGRAAKSGMRRRRVGMAGLAAGVRERAP